MDKKLKQAVIDEFTRMYPDAELAKYATSKIAEVVRLDNGMLVVIEKQPIKKHFCFGYGAFGMTYDEAVKAQRNASTNKEYFLRENMREYEDLLACVSAPYGGKTRFTYVLVGTRSDKLKYIEKCRLVSIVEAYGGAVYLHETKGDFVTMDNRRVYIPTDADRRAIQSGVSEAMAQHKKKVESYLKRYGLDKVRAWTYWQDE
jgi:hypothetical protein